MLTQTKMADFDEKWITDVQQYPCLYNTKSGEFKIRLKKENAWTPIAGQMKSSGKKTMYILNV